MVQYAVGTHAERETVLTVSVGLWPIVLLLPRLLLFLAVDDNEGGPAQVLDSTEWIRALVCCSHRVCASSLGPWLLSWFHDRGYFQILNREMAFLGM